ncbi:type II secretion system minor pseudopilin GspK [Parvularcula sp. LCG005]|uniref:type II secretion system minor pseudopilin GspK n=1 Tax=Parvularcula sp. LCG005 TaxID=3078805 RepID=UPI002942E326|nr:type II secretion system minor pseudopilin GspK [Parvularcula sp. LCG005]WOI54374.1 type II secretion system minor pseudopilin GspK [Parvularcula sp. LCG005]
MSRRQDQRGAALIIVLLLVGTMSTLALALTQVMQRATLRAAASAQRDEAVWALLGAERAALLLLDQQAQLRPKVDTLDEQWLAAPITLPVEAGIITVRMRDRSACFNMNDLVNMSEGQGQVVDRLAVRRFAEMVSQLGGDQRSAEILANAVVDFIDIDDRVEPGGAEDYNYNVGEAPYRTSGTYLADLSELRAVRGWSAGTYQALAPYLCALPADPFASVINVNTLTIDDAPLLFAIFEGRISLSELQRLIEQRPPSGYESVSAFMQQPTFTNISATFEEDPSEKLSTAATYIEFSARLSYEGQAYDIVSMIAAENGADYQVVSRRFGARDL